MFEDSDGLANVYLTDGTTRIEARAFANSSIATITLPRSITYIAPDAFQGCDVIAYVYAGTYAADYCAQHNIPTKPADIYEAFSATECRLADWFESEIDLVFFRRNRNTGAQCVATLYDISTGTSLQIRRVGGDYHADIETMTTEDTVKLCRIHGVGDASEINSRQHWERRPCLLLVGSRLYACSWYAVPHDGGRPENERLLDNGLNGYVMCLHFLNSRGHGSGSVDAGHQEAL